MTSQYPIVWVYMHPDCTAAVTLREHTVTLATYTGTRTREHTLPLFDVPSNPLHRLLAYMQRLVLHELTHHLHAQSISVVMTGLAKQLDRVSYD
jgi:hypothetical protein